MGAREPDRLQPRLVEGSERAPGGGIGGDISEERLLVAQRAQVGEAVAAVGEHERQVAHHPAGIVTRTPLAQALERIRKASRQPDAISDSGDKRSTRTRRQTIGVRNDL